MITGAKIICNARPKDFKRLQGIPDARKRPANYTPVCEQAADKADGAPWDCLWSQRPIIR